VVIVGTRKNYFYAKNSWGKLFGTNGYFRIGRDVEPKQLFDLKAECDYESNS
jgi:C1A family cysteine protease